MKKAKRRKGEDWGCGDKKKNCAEGAKESIPLSPPLSPYLPFLFLCGEKTG
jgi:hypothetical protein